MAKRRRGPIANRKHLARLERERRQTRLITYLTVAVVAMVVILIGFGLVYEQVLVPRQPVAEVNGVKISSGDFETRVRYERLQLVNRYLNTRRTMDLIGNDPNTQAFFINSLRQIELQLDQPDVMGRDLLNRMVEDVLIRQEAENRGITITAAEVDEAVQALFGYYAGGESPTPTAAPTLRPTSTFSPEQLNLVTLTPTPFVTPTATLSPDEPTPTASPTLPPQPTATPYTEEAFQELFNSTMSDLQQQINFTAADLRKIVESQLYRQKLVDEITADLPREQDQVWARQILVPDEATAQDVIQRLENGEDFGALAEELSTDSATQFRGGDLGWFGLGTLPVDVEKAAFNLQIGQISDPVQTPNGWYVIQVLGHEMRPLTNSEYERIRQQKFDEWLAKVRLEADVTLKEIWVERVPVDPAIPPEALLANQPPQQPGTSP